MRQRNLYKRLLQSKRIESFPIIKTLFWAIFLITGMSFTSTGQNTPPAFVAGHHQTLTICENDPMIDISTMMDITDPDAGDVEQWDTVAGLRNGTLGGFPNANLATGGVTSITGITYTANPGFSGLDSFTIFVTDGIATDTTTVVITVNPVPTVAPIVGPSIVCIGSSVIMTDDSTGGVWASSITGASSVIGGTVMGLSAGLDTIFYTVTAGTCFTVITKPVTVQPIPVAGSISGRRFVCQGFSITLTDPASGGVWSATNTNATVSGGVVTGMNVGADTIRYTVANGCGTAVASRVVTVDFVPYVSPISGPSIMCPGATVTLSDPDPGGSWSASNANATVGSTGDVMGVTVGVDTITYTLTLPCGTATTTYEVTVNVTPDPGVISGPTPAVLCQDLTITLTESVPSGFWGATNGNATVSSIGDVTGINPGPDTIRYTVFGACGISDTSFIINVLPRPNGGAISGLDTVCVTASITLMETIPGGGTWSAFNSNATVSPFGVVTGVAAGTDVISYAVPGSCGTGYATYPITILPQPVAGIITGPSMVCEASTVVLNDVAPGGAWSTSNTSASIVGTTGVATGVTAGVDTIIYTVTNYCATVQATVNLTVNPLPVAGSITGGNAVCVGNTITLTDAAPGGVWSNTNTHALAVTGGSVSGVSIGVDTIVYSVTNICGTATATHVVTVNDLAPVNAITGLSDLCADADITLIETTSGGVWTSSGTAAAVSGSGIVHGVSLGVVNISYTVTNICGSVTRTKTVSVDVVPVVDPITGPTAICPYHDFTLSDDVPGGTWSIDNGNALLDAHGNINGVLPGTAIVTYAVANHCGTSTTSFTVTIRPFDSCSNDGVHHVYTTGAELRLFPNPSTGSFTVLASSDVTEDAIITVTNLIGDKMAEVRASTNKEIPMQVNVPAGIYFVNVYTGHGRSQAKIMIQ